MSKIFSTSSAFAALKNDGSVVTWGDSEDGGDSARVAAKLSSGVVEIFSTSRAFAAVKSDGSVVDWGWFRGYSHDMKNHISGGVSTIFTTSEAFAALRVDGSVVAWGGPNGGEIYAPDLRAP